MAFPSASEIPILAALLLMTSFYAIRKHAFIATAYRRYVFMLMYFMQINLIIKLVVRIITNIQYVKDRAAFLKDTQAIIAVKSIWGDFDPKASDAKTRGAAVSELVSICLCIFFIQGWKTCKLLEIRYKT